MEAKNSFSLTLDSEAVRCGWRGEEEQGSPLMTQTTLSLQPITESCGSRWQPSGLSMLVISSLAYLKVRLLRLTGFSSAGYSVWFELIHQTQDSVSSVDFFSLIFLL